MVVKVGIMGSCVSDDIFRSPHNYKYWEDFKKSFIIARTSLISLAQKPIDVNRDELIINKETEYSEHNINCMYGDMTKRLYDVMTKDINYLVFDLFFDAFFGVLIWGDNIITNNYWHLPYTNFYKKLPEKKTVTPSDNLDDFMKLFKKYTPIFFDKMRTDYPDTKIILVSVRMMEYRTLDDGSVESYVNSNNPINKSLEIMEDYVRQNFGVFFIDFEETSLDKNHIWGPGKVHYSKAYYQYSYRKILNIVRNDEINLDNLTSDIKDLKLKNDSLASEINLIKQQLKRKEKIIEDLNNDKKVISSELNKVKEENAKLKEINDLMVNSTSWNITKPLRLISDKFK